MAGSRTLGETRQVEWVDCPKHGTAQPLQIVTQGDGMFEGETFSHTVYAEYHGPFVHRNARLDVIALDICPRMVGGNDYRTGRTAGYCPVDGCRAVLLIRKIRVPKAGASVSLHECGGACLGGKFSCECKCGGKCHGAGVCSCNVARGLFS